MAAVRRLVLCRAFQLLLQCAFLLLIPLSRFTSNVKAELLIPDSEVNNWAVRFGYHIHEISKYVSFSDNVKKGFQIAGARVERKSGTEMVKEMSNDIERMMAWKIQTVKRIADTAEQAMLGYRADEDLKEFEYNNAKTLNEEGKQRLELTSDKHFYDIPVNINTSSIHVPTNVYDRAASVVDAIQWSDHLDPIFRSNYHLDSSLHWQYFGSSTGFLRQYPAMKWTSRTVDTYDCRMRPWYIEAATSPKDMVILLDGSGSMTGLRKEIAKHVALNILDTLNDDDYFTIFRFSEQVEDLVPCFSGSLVPANMENIREYKKSLHNVNTSNIANFSIALTRAFEILHEYNRTGNGSMCNQAIMLITDGAPHAFEEIFNLYNQPNRHSVIHKVFRKSGVGGHFISGFNESRSVFQKFQKYKTNGAANVVCIMLMSGVCSGPFNVSGAHHVAVQVPIVRVFTYLIGQEMADERDVKSMACMNRGFYSHVSTLAEARDQVQHYINVMARPMVLNKRHSVIWTSVYADIEDPKMSDWLWERREKALQREKLQKYIRDYYIQKEQMEAMDNEDYQNDQEMTPNKDENPNCSSLTDSDSDEKKFSEQQFYRLMTTVAYPVIDPRNNSILENFSESYYRSAPWLHSQSKWDEDHVAEFLGVAGTDVPIEEITKLAPPYKLGVNGYAFGVTNNGYVLFHPDLRPVHDGILKPDYNSVDLAEVELRDNDLQPRGEDLLVLMLRRKMIDRELNHTNMSVKIHMDNSKRVITRVNHYFYAPLKDTPFSFGIAMPDGYGMYRIKGEINLTSLAYNRKSMDYERKVLSLFKENNWSLHPDWVYCRYLYSNPERPNRTVTETFLHFLESNRNGTFSFKHQVRVKQVPTSSEYFFERAKQINRDEFYCDKELVESVVFDAEATKYFGQRVQSEKKRPTTACRHRIKHAFVATRSGLTRWYEFESGSSNFSKQEHRAIDELWYKRAVDYHYVNDKAFVFSVPFDAGTRKNSLVTGSHALFLETHGRKAPAAVMGLQFDHENFTRTFLNLTTKCVNGTCKYHCLTEELNCYLLDDSGFIIASKTHEETGKFFGEIDSNIMNALVQDNIYKKISMVDYQAICFDPIQTSDAPSILMTPLRQIRHLFAYAWGRLLFFYLNYNFHSWWNGDLAEAVTNLPQQNDGEYGESSIHDRSNVIISKTRPKPCDKSYFLYQLQPKRFSPNVPRKGKLFCFANHSCNKSFVVQLVNNTNLLFMVVDATCKCEASRYSLEHSEIMYNESQMCAFLQSNIYRRRPDQCDDFHPQLVILNKLLACQFNTNHLDQFCRLDMCVGLAREPRVERSHKELEVDRYCGSAIGVNIPTIFVLFLLVAKWMSNRLFL